MLVNNLTYSNVTVIGNESAYTHVSDKTKVEAEQAKQRIKGRAEAHPN